MSMAMNGFYGYKALRRNIPLDANEMNLALEIGPAFQAELELFALESPGYKKIYENNSDSMTAQLLP